MRCQPVFQHQVDMSGGKKRVIVAVTAIGACRAGGAQPVEGRQAVRKKRFRRCGAIRALPMDVTVLVLIGAPFRVARPPTAT